MTSMLDPTMYALPFLIVTCLAATPVLRPAASFSCAMALSQAMSTALPVV